MDPYQAPDIPEPVIPPAPLPTATKEALDAYNFAVSQAVFRANCLRDHRSAYDLQVEREAQAAERLAEERRHREHMAPAERFVSLEAEAAAKPPERRFVEAYVSNTGATVAAARTAWAEIKRAFPTPIPAPQ